MVQGSELAEEEEEPKEVEEEVEEGKEHAGMWGQFAGSSCRVHGFGFRFSSLGTGFRISGSGFRVLVFGFRISGVEFWGRISGPGCTSHTMRSSSRSWDSSSENAYERRGNNLKRIKDFCLKAKARI